MASLIDIMSAFKDVIRTQRMRSSATTKGSTQNDEPTPTELFAGIFVSYCRQLISFLSFFLSSILSSFLSSFLPYFLPYFLPSLHNNEACQLLINILSGHRKNDLIVSYASR